jgi:hypothetical protein
MHTKDQVRFVIALKDDPTVFATSAWLDVNLEDQSAKPFLAPFWLCKCCQLC